MTLNDVINQLGALDMGAIICVRRPWSPLAQCIVTAPAENLGIPPEVKAAGFDYFLEVHVAHEVLRVFDDKPPTMEEKLRLLIHYAENDAYPEWVYTR